MKIWKNHVREKKKHRDPRRFDCADVVDEVVINYGVTEEKAWEIVTETTLYTAIANGSHEDVLVTPMHVFARIAVGEYVEYLSEPGEKIVPRSVLSDAEFALFLDENSLECF